MPRVLIITYYWPPSGGSGVQRWLKFAKYLPRKNWSPVIYTPLNPDFSIQDDTLLNDIPESVEVLKTKIWEPYALHRLLTGTKNKKANFGSSPDPTNKSLKTKVVSWVRGNLFLPDPRVYWVKPSVKYLQKYIDTNPVDIIVTTGPPHSMHLIGLALKKANADLRWIADMRDPWSTFDLLTQFNLSSQSMAKVIQMEKDVLNLADKIVMVSPSMWKEFSAFDKEKLEVINNGFDHEDFEQKTRLQSDDRKFRLIHAGLLNDIRDPESLWQSLKTLSQEIPDLKDKFVLDLIGTVGSNIQAKIQKDEKLSPLVKLHGYLSHSDLLKRYEQADGMLLVINKSRNAKAQIVGKVYEYLALKKPIVGIGPLDSDTAMVLKKTETGSMFDVEDGDGLKMHLIKLMSNKENGYIMNVNQKEIDRYSREALTDKMIQLFESISLNQDS